MKKLFFYGIFCVMFFQSKTQNIFTVAGNGLPGYTGDMVPATSVRLNKPYSVAVDGSGNVYIADCVNSRIRMVNGAGVILTVAGTNTPGFSGDGGLATNADLNNPSGIIFDALGNLYIADSYNNRIRVINTSGIISTFAGTNTAGFSGDGGAATAAELYRPTAVAFDAAGNVYIADCYNQRIRKVNTSGIISTFAGTGLNSYGGDGGAATAADLYNPSGIAIDAAGNVFIADTYNERIRKVNTSGIISTFAGTGVNGFSGDGGAATSAQLYYPYGISVLSSGIMYITDTYNHCIRKINTSGIISTIVGTGVAGFSGDGGVAINAKLNFPRGVCFDANGNMFIADGNNHRIREVCVSSCQVGINLISENSTEIAIFPNPNNGSFKIQIYNEIESGELILLNTLGQKVYTQKISLGENDINAKDLAKGLYHYLILENKKQISTGKITME